jgi:hypothetical protein
MSSRTSLQHVVSTSAPVGAALGDEWYNPTTNILYKRAVVAGVVGWATIGPIPSGTAGQVLSISSTGAVCLTTVATTQTLDTNCSYKIGDGLAVNTLGTSNLAIGCGALCANTSGTSNTAIGYRTLLSSSGASNVAIGAGTLQANTIGGSNTGVGSQALSANSSGSNNVGIGGVALSSLVSGSRNTAIGIQALFTTVSGSNNVGIGYYAGRYTTGSNELYINSIDQVNTANDKANSLIYGTFNATASAQTLALNGMVSVPYGITGSITSATSASFATTATSATTATDTRTATCD